MADDSGHSLDALAKRILRPTRRGFTGTLAGALANPRATITSGTQAVASAVLSGPQLELLTTAAFSFPNVEAAMRIPTGRFGLNENVMSNYFVDLAEASRAIRSLRSPDLQTITGPLNDAQRNTLAQYIFTTYGHDGETMSMGEAKRMVAGLFNAEGFRGKSISEFAGIAHARILQNVEILAPNLARLNTSALCTELLERNVRDAMGMPLRILQEFRNDVPQVLRQNWKGAFMDTRVVSRHINTQLNLKQQIKQKAGEANAGEVNATTEDKVEGWGRNWFVVRGDNGSFEFFCTENNPRKQRTILFGLEEQLRSEFFEQTTNTDMVFDKITRSLSFSATPEPGSKAEEILTGLAIESERILKANKQMAI